ncbi:MAG TPA: DUF1109 domain-containing protein [Rhizomicrobium sp.]|nr:DUF1109 domain-containing protein [Rhizomicrobium sp.]
MRTDDLIATLSSRLEPVRSGTVARVLLGMLGLGLAASTLVMLLGLGLRPDLGAAMHSFGMWTKLAYTFAIAGFGLWVVERAGRPGAPLGRPLALLALPLLAIALLAGLQMAQPGADARSLVMGHSALVCPFIIVLVAAPALLAAFWGLRRLAPTRLGLAGAGAGLFAGALGAFVYAFYCTEVAAPFIAVWYTLGIALTSLLGGILGRWALRW